MRDFQVITFDCYGTLIDWESGIRDAFLRAAQEDGVAIDPSGIIPAYSEVEPVVEQESYRRYRGVLTESAVRTARRLGWELSLQRASFLAGSLPSWPSFADTNRALEKLRAAGYRLGILSNVDDDLLEATRRHFTVELDLVITAQQVGSYKPAAAHFSAARKRIGGKRWLHAAASNFHDIVPANALGLPTAWINRTRSMPLPGGQPSYEYPDLASFAEAMTRSEPPDDAP
ncbi:MAG TPA: HAD-IA family hydrolase [Thermoanaerobaculia bacterium]|nr:HAD-IA family hydrolase [Thermoanaerobaculia bacterium]